MPDKPGLKMYLIGPKLEQIHKIRAMLQDHKSTAGRIKKPKYMKTALFERRLAKLKRLEKELKKLFHDGMLAEFEKSVTKIEG